MTAAPPADDNALVEQAIARVLAAEHSARASIADAQIEAAKIAERARAAARAVDERALRRIVAIRARFEARIAEEVVAFDAAAARLDTQYALDGGPPVASRQNYPIDGLPINPVARANPRDFIETGVTTLDLMNSLVRGQKLPLFSGGGLPHDRLAVEIASHARLRKEAGGDFAIVFAGIGVPFDSAEFFRRSLEQGGRSSVPRCSSILRAIRRRSDC